MNEIFSVSPDASPVLVVVVNDAMDLARARNEGWYRIPLARAPRRLAAEWLAFYQTGAFPPEERWAVRWLAPVRGYRVAARRDLLPGETEHPRAGQLYYQVRLGPLQLLEHPIPSRRLRRITFIPTTLARLEEAEEINDLWIKSTAQQRLWTALKQAGVEAERQYPLEEGLPDDETGVWMATGRVADFALPGSRGGAALLVVDEPVEGEKLYEAASPDYALARAGWRVLVATCVELASDPDGWAAQLAALKAHGDS